MEQDEIVDDEEKAALGAPPDPRKREKLSAIDGASSSSESVACLRDAAVDNILARLPVRTAIACTALSKRHRRQVRSPEFRTLHCRLGAPLPHPHIAYLTSWPVRQRGYRGRVSGFHGFHVAGAGAGGLGSTAPIRALAGGRYLKKRYVNTCNGVVLLASEITKHSRTTTFVLWNPAVADDDKQVAVPCPTKGSYRILGLGYGRRSKTYKLLLCRRCRLEDGEPPLKKYSNELLVYTLGAAGGGDEEQPRLVMALPEGTMCGGIIQESIYMDGTIYLLHDFLSAVILAFDVDDETVTTIDVPGERDPDSPSRHARSKLMVMSGRPFLATNHGHHRVALWLLTADHRWEQVCVIGDDGDAVDEEDVGPGADRCMMSGIWDCGGVLAMYLGIRSGEYDQLCLYHVASEKMYKANLPRDLTPEETDFALCWSYKPTLVSPGDIVGELSQDEKEEERRRRTANIMEALKPGIEKDMWKGHEETLDTVCFMDFLVRIMRKLPDNLQDVLEMPMLNPGDPGFFFETASFTRIQHIYWTN